MNLKLACLILVIPLACAKKENPFATTPKKPIAVVPVEKAPADSVAIKHSPASSDFIYQIIPAANGTFGYEIQQYGTVLIRQLTRPSLPGNEGFASREQAEKVAALVLGKLKAGQMPPTITREEMETLGIH